MMSWMYSFETGRHLIMHANWNAHLDHIGTYISDHSSLFKEMLRYCLKWEDINCAFWKCYFWLCSHFMLNGKQTEVLIPILNTKDSQHLLIYLLTHYIMLSGKFLSSNLRLYKHMEGTLMLRIKLPNAPHAAHCFIPKVLIFYSHSVWPFPLIKILTLIKGYIF